MAQLRQDHDQFEARDVAVVILGPEDAQKFAAYFSKHAIPFTGIPDPKHKILKQYGQEIKIFKFGRMPAQVLVDKDGIARFVHYGKSMKDIPENDEIIALVEQMNESNGVEDMQTV